MFPTTSWTVIAAAGVKSSGSEDALSRLCYAYWYPIYALIRRRGHSREDAEDLTQEFFAHILQHGAISEARRERGRFRWYLRASVEHFLANEWDRAHAVKRGGLAATLSLDFQAGEERYR